jgi:hypothetical protein
MNVCDAVGGRLLKINGMAALDKGDKPHSPAALATLNVETETEITWTWRQSERTAQPQGAFS